MFRKRDKSLSSPPAALMLDFDEVINLSAEPDGTGFIGGTLIAGESLTGLNQFCKKMHIPIYVITNRSNSPKNFEHIWALLNAAGGCSKDHEMGGFKLDRVHCLGIDSPVRPKKKSGSASALLMGVRTSKVNIVKSIHKEELSALPNNKIIMLDDNEENLKPIREAGYQCLLVEEKSQNHFDQAKEFFINIVNNPYLNYAPASSSSSSSTPTLVVPASFAQTGRASTAGSSLPACARNLFSSGASSDSSTHRRNFFPPAMFDQESAMQLNLNQIASNEKKLSTQRPS